MNKNKISAADIMNDREPATRDKGSFGERRRQADWVVHGAAILSLIAWLVAFVVVLVVEFAAPTRYAITALGDTPDTVWNTALLPVAFGLLIASLIACVAAFIFNMMRMRRKTDKIRKSIVIIGAATVVGVIFFAINFGPYMF